LFKATIYSDNRSTHFSEKLQESHMIEHKLDSENSILYLWPKSALEQSDFAQLAKIVDPYIEATGGLVGLIIETNSFPGWEDFTALATHFRFVKNHHRHIKKIALVTDSAIGNIAELLVTHFVSAQIKHFNSSESEAARHWVMKD
jgi:hypothetical protein